MLNPLDPSRRIQAVLFDLDGTLYRQALLRSLMAMELLTLPFSGFLKAPQRWQALRTYRKTQEQLRATDERGSAAAAQLLAAARATGLTVPEVERLVDEWMLARPLKYLQFCRAKGLDRLLGFLEQAGVRTGVLSDYPAGIEAAGARSRRTLFARAVHERAGSRGAQTQPARIPARVPGVADGAG